MLAQRVALTHIAAMAVPQQSAQVPSGSRIYAVGDVHGRVDLLRALHQLIHDDACRHPAARNVVVYLGDYIDRGQDSSGVIELLLDAPLPGFSSVHLKGNHEDALLRFLDDTRIGPAWLFYGGADTLRSYGVAPPFPPTRREELLRAQAELRQLLPERHRRFMESLPFTYAEGDYLFVHAGLRPGVPLEQQSPEDMLWIRDEFLYSDENFGRVVVHGHSITPRPDVQRNRIGIDTGAYASDRLTALVLEGDGYRFLQT
jgi:serine/threonine protein phosphatase 1